MGIEERRRREKERRRNTILAAAERVFAEQGVDASTMEEIAESAELSKGLIYHYFNSKDALLSAVAERGTCLLASRFEEEKRRYGLGIDQVEAMGRAYARFFREQHTYFEAMIHWSARRTGAEDASGAGEDRAIALVAESVAAGMADGSIRPDLDPLKTAIVLWAQTHGLLQIAQMKPHAFDFSAVSEYAFSFARDCLAACGHSRPSGVGSSPGGDGPAPRR